MPEPSGLPVDRVEGFLAAWFEHAHPDASTTLIADGRYVNDPDLHTEDLIALVREHRILHANADAYELVEALHRNAIAIPAGTASDAEAAVRIARQVEQGVREKIAAAMEEASSRHGRVVGYLSEAYEDAAKLARGDSDG